MAQVSPLGAVLRGAAAGAVGSAAQSAFFKLAGDLAPKPPGDAFRPPEPEQKDEGETETVARRIVEKLAQRGPLSDEQKAIAGQVVHFGFGAGWGAVYGLARETLPLFANPLGMAAFGVGVWAASDDLLLPLLKVAGPPQRYPAKSHAFAIAAHLVYGGAVGATYALLRPRTLAAAGAMLWLANARRRVRKVVPREVRPLAFAFAKGVARGLANRPLLEGAAGELVHELH